MYNWNWSWDEAAPDMDRENPHYPDHHDARGYHWITVNSYGPEGLEGEICTLPLYVAYPEWRTLIPEYEGRAQMICDALNSDLHDLGG